MAPKQNLIIDIEAVKWGEMFFHEWKSPTANKNSTWPTFTVDLCLGFAC